MNGRSLGVPDLTDNKVGFELKAKLFVRPHTSKRMIFDNSGARASLADYILEHPVKVKIYWFLADIIHGIYEYRWSTHTVIRLTDNCFFNSVGLGKPWWAIIDYKILD